MTPENLVGLDEAQVTHFLGGATDVRQAPPAVVWEYRTDTCALDLFFYMDVSDKKLRTLAYDLKTSESNTTDQPVKNCLTDIRRQANS